MIDRIYMVSYVTCFKIHFLVVKKGFRIIYISNTANIFVYKVKYCMFSNWDEFSLLFPVSTVAGHLQMVE